VDVAAYRKLIDLGKSDSKSDRHRLGPSQPRPPENRLAQAARPARRRGDREQEVVEL